MYNLQDLDWENPKQNDMSCKAGTFHKEVKNRLYIYIYRFKCDA